MLQGYSSLYKNNKMRVILSNYLHKNQKAIYPYYFKEIFTDETVSNSIFIEDLNNIAILNSDVKDDITLEEKIKLLEKSGIEDNIQLAKELKRIPKVKFVDKMIIGNILKRREKIINKRIERFIKDEN